MENLFDISIDAKKLHDYKLYDDLVTEIEQAVDTSDRLTTKYIGTSGDNEIIAVYAGNPDAEKRIMIASDHHGGEEAGPMAAVEMIKEIAHSNSPTMKRLLDEAYISIVPAVDAQGFDHRGRKFVDMDGNGELWPHDKERWWSDINGTHGRRDDGSKPPEVIALEEAFDEFKPGLVFDLHETVSTPGRASSPLLNTRGMMVIETPLDGEEGYGDGIVRNLVDRGYDIFHEGLIEKIVQKIAPIPEQVIKVGEARFGIGPLIEDVGVKVFGMWAKDRGASSYTFETFDNPLSYRVEQQMAGVEGGILDFMGYKPTERLVAFKGKVVDANIFAKGLLGEGNYEIASSSHVKSGLFSSTEFDYTRIMGNDVEIDLYGKAGSFDRVVEVKYARAADSTTVDSLSSVVDQYIADTDGNVLSEEQTNKEIDSMLYQTSTAFKQGVESVAASIAGSAYLSAVGIKDSLVGIFNRGPYEG